MSRLEAHWSHVEGLISAQVPPVAEDGDEDPYAQRFAKLEAFLQSRRRDGGGAEHAVVAAPGAREALTSKPRLVRLDLDDASDGWRDEWLALECDAVVARDRCYRLALHWLLFLAAREFGARRGAARRSPGPAISDYVTAMHRRATRPR